MRIEEKKKKNTFMKIFPLHIIYEMLQNAKLTILFLITSTNNYF